MTKLRRTNDECMTVGAPMTVLRISCCGASDTDSQGDYERCAFECRDVIPTADALLVRHSDAGELWVKALSEKNGVKA